jgi:hypothetical protein
MRYLLLLLERKHSPHAGLGVVPHALRRNGGSVRVHILERGPFRKSKS